MTAKRLLTPYPMTKKSSKCELIPIRPIISQLQAVECAIREALDNTLAQHLRGSVSFVNFPDGPPERALDLGCGVSLDLDLFTTRL